MKISDLFWLFGLDTAPEKGVCSKRHYRNIHCPTKEPLPCPPLLHQIHIARSSSTLIFRATPTLFLTDNETVPAKEVITRYIARNTIENDLGININFFHLDCLASEVRLNVNTDVVMTVLANGCYRWLSERLKGCQTMEPKQLYRKFIETGGRLTVRGDEIVVCLDRRSHNPVIAQARLDKECGPIPWLNGKRLRFEFK